MPSLAGSFLIARPTLTDGFFHRTVILLLQHGPDGAFGLVLNRPQKQSGQPFPIHIGGPCKFQGVILLHGQEDWVEEKERHASQICPGVYLGDSESMKRLTDEEEPPVQGKYRVFAGYSGWGPGQLDSELAQGAWAVVRGGAKEVFDIPTDELWLRMCPSPIPQPSLN